MPKRTSALPNKIFFTAALLFASLFICHSDRLGGFFSNCQNNIWILFAKMLLAIALSSFSTFWLLHKTNDYAFMTKALCAVTALASVLTVADTYLLHFYGSNFMYETIHTMYFLSAVFASFVTATIYTAARPNAAYRKFYKWLWISVTPILLFLFVRVFIREPSNSYSVNLEPFYRIFEMLTFIRQNFRAGIVQTYVLLGNMLFFIPIGFLIPFYLKRLPGWAQCLTGLALPVLIELYQWFFRCGDVDVDDVILNYAGFLFGFALCKWIEKKILRQNRPRRER